MRDWKKADYLALYTPNMDMWCSDAVFFFFKFRHSNAEEMRQTHVIRSNNENTNSCKGKRKLNKRDNCVDRNIRSEKWFKSL